MWGYDYTSSPGGDIEIAPEDTKLYVLPPAGIPHEKWELLKLTTYGLEQATDYYTQFYRSWYDTIPVNVVIYQDSIWIQGMVNWSSYSFSHSDVSESWNIKVPNARVRAKYSEERIDFEPRQLSCEIKSAEIGEIYKFYISLMHATSYLHSGNTASLSRTEAEAIESIEVIRRDVDGRMGFACGGDCGTCEGADGLAIFEGSEVKREYGFFLGHVNSYYDETWGGKGLGIYGNLRLIKGSSNAVQDVKEFNKEYPEQYYDLMGRSYSTRPVTPGIYIYKGRKIIIK